MNAIASLLISTLLACEGPAPVKSPQGDPPAKSASAKTSPPVRTPRHQENELGRIIDMPEKDVLVSLKSHEAEAQRIHRLRLVELARALGQGRLVLDLGEDTLIECLYVVPGHFRIGRTEEEVRDANIKANAIQHEPSAPMVKGRLERGFFLSKFEITNRQYGRYRSERGDSTPLGELDEPVVGITWKDAMGYCDWIAKKTGWKARLPTEVEWEYAARGRSATRYGTISSGAQSGMDPNWAPEELDSAQAVGTNSFDVSWCGVHDLTANVSEWVYDLYEETLYRDLLEEHPRGMVYSPVLEPVPKSNPGPVRERVHRGGSYRDLTVNCEAATRRRKLEDDFKDYIGFRVALILPVELFETPPEPAR